MENLPICLTRNPKKVLNRDTYYLSHFMSFNKIGSGLTAAVALAASSVNAQEADQSVLKALEATEQAERDAVVQVTRAQCLAITDRDGKIGCLKQLKVQREAEIAALDEVESNQNTEIATRTDRIANKTEENATLVAATEAEQQANAERHTTNAVLSNENEQLAARVEGLRQLRDITREEIERDPSSN